MHLACPSGGLQAVATLSGVTSCDHKCAVQCKCKMRLEDEFKTCDSNCSVGLWPVCGGLALTQDGLYMYRHGVLYGLLVRSKVSAHAQYLCRPLLLLCFMLGQSLWMSCLYGIVVVDRAVDNDWTNGWMPCHVNHMSQGGGVRDAMPCQPPVT